MNISQFVFRDLNRNGVFDLGESPFAGAPIRLEQGAGDPIVRPTNLSGFANFPMSDDQGDADIVSTGPVSFMIEVPDGYVLTTESAVHRAEIQALGSAPGGFVMDPPNPFMGIAPTLTIEAASAGVVQMVCERAEDRVEAERSRDALICPVAQGTWRVMRVFADGETQTREVTVQDWPVRLPRAGGGGNLEATMTEGFDGIITSENIQEMPSSDGLVWHNIVAAHRKYYGGHGYVNGTASGAFAGYTSSGHPGTLKSEAPFSFHGALISVAWPGAVTHPVRITGLRDGEVVGEDTFLASNLRPLWFDAAWSDLDTLIIAHDAYWQVVIDDVVLSRGSD